MRKNTITAYFQADHDRLDQLFRQFQETKRRDLQASKPFFRGFRSGLRRHIIWEEEILFPLFEKKSGRGRGMGPTAVMRGEHEIIQDLLETLHEKIRNGDARSEEQEKALLEVLGGHNTKEEHVLYPAIDQLASEEEAAEVFADMEEVPEERWKCGCGHSHAAASTGAAV